jgi:hypothetical protein
MTEPIGNIGGAQDLTTARISGDYMSGDASGGGQQLGQILSILAREFGGYASEDQIAVLLSSIRLVVGAGVPAVDVADAMYSNPAVLDAMREGNPESAKQAIVSQLSETLTDLRASSVPQASLHALSGLGFAAGEIAVAIRNLPNLRDELMLGNPAMAKQMASTLHDFFRDAGRSTHDDPSATAALGAAGGAPGTWFEQYMHRIRAAQRRTIGEVRPEDHPETMLIPPPASAIDFPASFGSWMFAAIVAAAVLLLILARC